MEDDVETMILRRGFRAGFAASREGFNGECEYDHLAPGDFTDRSAIEEAAVSAFLEGELETFIERLRRPRPHEKEAREVMTMPLRDMMMPESFYQDLDVGIRFAVRVLHAAGVHTCQSCQGGTGHAYDQPTVDLIARGDDAIGFRALAALVDYGLPVADVSIVWPVRNGLPYEKLWRVTFTTAMHSRADEHPIFIHGYRAALARTKKKHATHG